MTWLARNFRRGPSLGGVLKFIALNMAVLLILGLGVETVLRATDERPQRAATTTDFRVFERTRDAGGREVYRNRFSEPSALGGDSFFTRVIADGIVFNLEEPFPPSAFPVVKSPEAFRIFVLGSSPLYVLEEGGNMLDFGAVLREVLKKRFPRRDFQVANCSAKAFDQDSMKLILSEVLSYEPDLVLIYFGHISPTIHFRFDRDLILSAGVKNRILRGLSRLRIYSNLIRPLFRPPGRPVRGRDLSTGARTYDDTDERTLFVLRKFIREVYRLKTTRTVETISRQYRLARVPLALYTVHSNIAAPPLRSAHSERVSRQDIQRFENLMNAGREGLRAGRFSSAARDLRGALSIDKTHAGAHFLFGRILRRLGEDEKATEELLLAARYDAGGARIEYILNPILSRAAGKPGIHLIDLFESLQMPRGGNPRFFSDQTHFTWEGMRVIGKKTADWLASTGLL